MKLITFLFLLAFTLPACKKNGDEPPPPDPCQVKTDSTALEVLWKVENIISSTWRVNTSIRPIPFNGNVLTSNQPANNTILTMRDGNTGAPLWEKELPSILPTLLPGNSFVLDNGKLYMELQGQITSLDLTTQETELIYDVPLFSAHYIQVFGKYLLTQYIEDMETTPYWRSEDKILLIDLETKAAQIVYAYAHSHSSYRPLLLDPTLWLSAQGDTKLTFLKITDTLESIHREYELTTLNLSQNDTLYNLPIKNVGSYSGNLLIHDQRIFIPTENAVLGFDGASGDQRWKVDVSSYYGDATYLLFADNKLIAYCKHYCSATIAIDPATGSILWRSDYLDLYSRADYIAIENGKAFFSTYDAVKAIDLATGCLLWHRPRVKSYFYLTGGVSIDPILQHFYLLDEENIYCVNFQ